MKAAVFAEPMVALETVFPELKGYQAVPQKLELQNIPLWLRNACAVFYLDLPTSGLQLALILPKSPLPFELVIRITHFIESQAARLAVVIADELNPKYRPLMVRHGIAFIYGNNAVFIPRLGLKILNLRPYRLKTSIGIEPQNKALSPMALKLAAAILLEWIPKEFRLHDLHVDLVQKKKYVISLSKLSLKLAEMVGCGLLEARGAGPSRLFVAADKDLMWNSLHQAERAHFFKVVRSNYSPSQKGDYVIAGELALAHYSNLAKPKEMTIATTSRILREMRYDPKREAHGDFGSPGIVIEIWKEDPRLYSFEGMINPIELYFSMRENPDERVQMELEKMLAAHGLSPKGE